MAFRYTTTICLINILWIYCVRKVNMLTVEFAFANEKQSAI